MITSRNWLSPIPPCFQAFAPTPYWKAGSPCHPEQSRSRKKGCREHRSQQHEDGSIQRKHRKANNATSIARPFAVAPLQQDEDKNDCARNENGVAHQQV